MELTHRFTVPTSVEETWAHFGDLAGVGECFPGATVTEADGDSFSGTVKVKLGPIAMLYKGEGEFVSKDEEAKTFQIKAKGKDKRGNGTAAATVDLSMQAADGSGTDVKVVTDLAVTGKPAQFGRGVMQDVSDKLLGQFVDCLEQQLGTDAAATGDGEEVVAEPAPTAATPGKHAAHIPPPAVSTPPTPPTPIRSVGGSDDAIDLGATVLPVLLRSYWKPVAGVFAVLFVWRLIASRRGR